MSFEIIIPFLNEDDACLSTCVRFKRVWMHADDGENTSALCYEIAASAVTQNRPMVVT